MTSDPTFAIFLEGAYCDRSFKTTIQLTNHVNTHLGVKPFQVRIHPLDRQQRPSSSLAVQILFILIYHERRTHPTCPIQVSLRPSSFPFTPNTIPIRRHTLEKPHRCEECGYATVELSKLRRHIRTHTGVRRHRSSCHTSISSPFRKSRTPVLTAPTAVRTLLNSSVIYVFIPVRQTRQSSLSKISFFFSGERPYQCTICNFRFTQSNR